MAYAIGDGDIKSIAVGCLYILMGRGYVNFPGSDRSRPASRVVVNRNTGPVFRDGDAGFFPFSVPWDVWHLCVVPVLQDRSFQIKTGNGSRNNLNQRSVELREWGILLSRIESALRRKLDVEGYLQMESEDSIVEETGPEDGEPIVRQRDVGDPGYPNRDVDGSTWPEGHLKLIYPIIN